MNNATASPAAATESEASNHYGNVEEQICDLVRAADIAATLLETALKDAHPERLPAEVEKRLIFAAYQVDKRAKTSRARQARCQNPSLREWRRLDASSRNMPTPCARSSGSCAGR